MSLHILLCQSTFGNIRGKPDNEEHVCPWQLTEVFFLGENLPLEFTFGLCHGELPCLVKPWFYHTLAAFSTAQ